MSVRTGTTRLRAFAAMLAAVLLTANPALIALAASQQVDPGSPEAAVAVIRDYYEAINAGDFERAYQAWESDGQASGQTFEEFTQGFAGIEQFAIESGPPGQISAAAGSRYIMLPITVTATTADGRTHLLEGTYTLRRSVVDGATPKQQAWHIYSASIPRIPVPPDPSRPACPVPVDQAQTVDVCIDRGDGSTYRVGDPIKVCATANIPVILIYPPPPPPTVRVVSTTNDGPEQAVFEDRYFSGQHCWQGFVAPPAGDEVVRADAIGEDGKVFASDAVRFTSMP